MWQFEKPTELASSCRGAVVPFRCKVLHKNLNKTVTMGKRHCYFRSHSWKRKNQQESRCRHRYRRCFLDAPTHPQPPNKAGAWQHSFDADKHPCSLTFAQICVAICWSVPEECLFSMHMSFVISKETFILFLHNHGRKDFAVLCRFHKFDGHTWWPAPRHRSVRWLPHHRLVTRHRERSHAPPTDQQEEAGRLLWEGERRARRLVRLGLRATSGVRCRWGQRALSQAFTFFPTDAAQQRICGSWFAETLFLSSRKRSHACHPLYLGQLPWAQSTLDASMQIFGQILFDVACVQSEHFLSYSQQQVPFACIYACTPSVDWAWNADHATHTHQRVDHVMQVQWHLRQLWFTGSHILSYLVFQVCLLP